MLRGETVRVKTRGEETGRDDYNASTTEEQIEVVDNVLVMPANTDNLDATRPNGVDVQYTLYFPKTYGKPMEIAEVEVRGEWYKTQGYSDIIDPEQCPTDWNMVVVVSGTHG